MALSDPQSLTINSVATSFPRIETDGMKAVYRTADGLITFTISHQSASKRSRRMVRVDQKVLAADPITAVNQYQNLGVYIVIDQPDFGYSSTQIGYITEALKTWLTTAMVAKLVGGES